MGALLDQVARRLETEQEWAEIEAAYERLHREDPAGWQEYAEELAVWEAVGADVDSSAAEEWPEYNR